MQVVKEERRLRVDNSPYGRFSEEFQHVAFPDQPYGRPVIGYPGDLEALGRREVDAFFRQHYRPDTLTCAVVGDVNPTQVQRLAEKVRACAPPEMFVFKTSLTRDLFHGPLLR